MTDSQSVIDDDSHYRESFPNIKKVISQKAAKSCRLERIKRRLPITKWLPRYEKSFVMLDFVAGLSVGLTAIPQGIAYAVVAGLPPQYGLYSGLVGKFWWSRTGFRLTILIFRKQVRSCTPFLEAAKTWRSVKNNVTICFKSFFKIFSNWLFEFCQKKFQTFLNLCLLH